MQQNLPVLHWPSQPSAYLQEMWRQFVIFGYEEKAIYSMEFMKFKGPNTINWCYHQFIRSRYYNCSMISRATWEQSIHWPSLENIFLDAFSNFTLAVVTLNQQVKTVTKVPVDKWLYTYRMSSRIHSNQGKSFDNKIIKNLCIMYGIKQSGMTLTHGNPKCERFNRTLDELMKMLPKSQITKLPVHLNSMQCQILP